MDKPTVFIGSSKAALETAELVKRELSSVAAPVLWNDDSFLGLGFGTFEALVNALDRFDFAILLFTPDDPVVHDGHPKFKPRDNVLIEFGLFTGGLGRDRTFAMIPFHTPIHIPTDLAGVTVAELRPSADRQHQYDVMAGCTKIANTIRTKWRRRRLDGELGILYRLVNAFTFPHYKDVPHPALNKVKYRSPEKFEKVDDVIEFLADLLAFYIYPQLNLGQLESMRIYFAYYLGEGCAQFSVDSDPNVCWDQDADGNQFGGEFVIGLANPSSATSERNWRVGRAIRGYSGVFPKSLCAKVFRDGHRDGFPDAGQLPPGMPNYWTPGELSVYAFPVEWRSEEGAGRIGVITVSARDADSIGKEMQTLIELLANVVGFLFSLYAVRDRHSLEQEGAPALERYGKMIGFSPVPPDTDAGRRFAAAATGLRRSIAGYFERNLVSESRHQLIDGKLVVSQDTL